LVDECAAAIQKEVVEPWLIATKRWLKTLKPTGELRAWPDAADLRSLLGRMVRPNERTLVLVLRKFYRMAADLAGNNTIGQVARAYLELLAQRAEREDGLLRAPEAVLDLEDRAAWAAEFGYRPGPGSGPTYAEALKRARHWQNLSENSAFRLTDDALLLAYQNRGTLITGLVTQTMLDDLHEVLDVSAYFAGLPPNQVAEDLEGIFPETYAGRASNIARTEMAEAYSLAQEAEFEDAGVASRKWVSMEDFSVRPDHAILNGQIRRLGEPWITPGGDVVPRPGAGPARQACNCRCDLDPVLDENFWLGEEPWLGDARL
jgi:SPP1 gp7 family putative phage head morphogenesis protein